MTLRRKLAFMAGGAVVLACALAGAWLELYYGDPS